MGRLLEHHSKQLLKEMGIAVPLNEVAGSETEAAEAARRMGKPVVVKALVPVGKRGKAGAIKFAETPEEAAEKSRELLGMTVRNFPVEKVLVEEKLDIDREWYLSITYDKSKQVPVIIASTRGGVDVEELNRSYSGDMVICPVDPLSGLAGFKAREIWADLGVGGKLLGAAGTLLNKLYAAFDRYDAYLLEVNPLVVTTGGELVAAATVMSVDDSAIYRQPRLADMVQLGSERAWRPLTELEKQMVEVNESDPYRGTARYTEMPGGDIGFMCGGGGGSLLCFDTLVALGGRPANYSEVGGNPPEPKVYGLTKGILSKPGVRGLFVAHNITNNTQVDVLARGIVRALQDLHIDPATFPVVVREAGVNDAVAREIFTAAGVEYYGDDMTMTGACARMVARMKEVYGEGRQQ
ncbi:MAG TPA: succinate--CoA ligase [Desulfotomaculum sp.]|nr:succinate--CoA ligase [Desulfotomaculum sp.]